MLVHGLGLSTRIWNRLTPLLGEKVSVLDLPGHGESDLTKYNWNDLWDVIFSVIEPDEWPETTLVLHSFTASLLPEIIFEKLRPAKLVLLEGILHSDDAYWSNDLALLDDVQYFHWLDRFRSVSEMALKSQLCSRQEKRDLMYWSEAFKVVKGDALRVIATNLKKRLDSVAIVHSIKSASIPIVYLRGGRSRLSVAGQSLLEHNAIRIIEISSSGHFPMIDNPVDLAFSLRML